MKYYLASIVIFLTAVLLGNHAHGREYIPRAAYQYQSYLIRSARFEFGMEAPVPLLAGQIHQESAWNPRAKSAFASGLSQFTPDTEKWIIGLFPDLGIEGVQDPHWAIRAMVRYDKRLLGQITADTVCDDWAFVLASYNGGLGWVLRDKKLAVQNGKSRNKWWGNVELYSGRAPHFIKENRDYPVKILLKHQPQYLKQGSWGAATICGDKL